MDGRYIIPTATRDRTWEQDAQPLGNTHIRAARCRGSSRGHYVVCDQCRPSTRCAGHDRGVLPEYDYTLAPIRQLLACIRHSHDRTRFLPTRRRTKRKHSLTCRRRSASRRMRLSCSCRSRPDSRCALWVTTCAAYVFPLTTRRSYMMLLDASICHQSSTGVEIWGGVLDQG